MTPSSAHLYCECLGIPVPRVEDAAGRPGVTLSQLAAVALLEHGGPLLIEELDLLAGVDLRSALRALAFDPERFDLRLVNRQLEGSPDRRTSEA